MARCWKCCLCERDDECKARSVIAKSNRANGLGVAQSREHVTAERCANIGFNFPVVARKQLKCHENLWGPRAAAGA
jgi:hypothetical protein